MNRLLPILILTSCPFLLMAQTESTDTSILNDKKSVLTESAVNPNEMDYTVLRPKNLQPGVNRLPLDGTPCMVPDTDSVVPMPNAWKGPLRVPFKKKKPVALYNEFGSKPILN